MSRKWLLAASFTAMSIAAFVMTTAAVTKQPAVHAAMAKPAKLNPFTGKYTTNYRTGLDGLTYYLWRFNGESSYCIWDPSGGGSGTDTVLDPCAANQDDYWAVGTWSGGSWSGDFYLENESSSVCLDDVNGADNIRLPVKLCAEVGGQSWFSESVGSTPEACGWRNAISGKEAVTLDYGTVKNGAWIVTNPWGITNIQEYWNGPGPDGCG